MRSKPFERVELEVIPSAPQWVVFTHDHYDAKSPWADQRVRLAANHAINRQAINEAEPLGYSLLTGVLCRGNSTMPCPSSPMHMAPRKPNNSCLRD